MSLKLVNTEVTINKDNSTQHRRLLEIYYKKEWEKQQLYWREKKRKRKKVSPMNKNVSIMYVLELLQLPIFEKKILKFQMTKKDMYISKLF